MDQTQEDSLRFPGLKWKKRAGGAVPFWYPPEADRREGYPVKSADLRAFAHDRVALSRRCEQLHGELMMWRRHGISTAAGVARYDGTFGAALDVWLTDPESDFHKVKPGTRHPYLVYAAKLKRHIGPVSINSADGRDAKRWFNLWSAKGKHVPAGRMVLTVLKAALTFGVISRNADCIAFKAILSEMEFPGNKPRDVAPTAQQVQAAIGAAHAAGAPRRALAYALQYETQARQWDITGQWFPMSDPRPSTVTDRGQKWFGPHWHQVDDNLILRTIHSKTEGWTDARGVYDLAACPMVKAEIERIPLEQRTGPLIVNERTGLPYRYDAFKDGWKADFKAAGLPASFWGRDLRAGGNTEASKGGANKEDRAKVSGHSVKVNAQVYDRDMLEAHRRLMQARLAVRNAKAT